MFFHFFSMPDTRTAVLCVWMQNFRGKKLTAALLDAASGKPIEPFTLHNSVPLVASDSTRSALVWRGAPSDGIAQLRGRSVRIVFCWGQPSTDEEPSSLFSFWVATSACGASRGYVAGGGPGIGGDIDTKGSCDGRAPPGVPLKTDEMHVVPSTNKVT